MKSDVPNLKFKLFYLPKVPAATTTEGHIMKTINGFTNIEKERIELNIYPPRECPSIFRTLVHEIIHISLLESSKIEEATLVEEKVEATVNEFLKSSPRTFSQ